MLRANAMFRLAMALAAGVLMGPVARGQEKPKETTAKGAATAVQAKAADAGKEAKKEPAPAPPKPRIAVFRLAGAVKETPTDEVFNFGGETGVPLRELVERMDKAAKDGAVKAVVIVPRPGDGRPGPGRGAAAGDRPRPGRGQGGHRPRRHDRRASASTPCSRRPRG